MDNAVRSLIDEMLPLATLVTQSKPEAELSLSQDKRVSIPSLVVLVLVSAPAVETSIPIRPKIESASTHGCTLSAAISCGLASGLTSDTAPLPTSLEINHGKFSTGGCSNWDNFRAPMNSACSPNRNRSLTTRLRPLRINLRNRSRTRRRRHELRGLVSLSYAMSPNACSAIIVS